MRMKFSPALHYKHDSEFTDSRTFHLHYFGLMKDTEKADLRFPFVGFYIQLDIRENGMRNRGSGS